MKSDSNNIRRRDFLKYGGQAAVAASLAGTMGMKSGEAGTEPSSKTTTGSASQNAPDFIIDSHIHVRGNDEWVNEMVDMYRKHNAMACALAWPEDMEFMMEAMDAYPDVFIGYGRTSVDDPMAVRHVKTFYENGFLGMKFHSPRKQWDDPSYYQVYRLCEEFGMHMLFHTGITSRRNIDGTPRYGSMANMRPVYLDALCRLFPNTTIQGAHFGNPWYEEAAECARWNPNLYFDVTGSSLFKFNELDRMDIMSQYLWWAQWDAQDTNPHTLQGGPGAWEHIVFGVDEGPSGLPGNIELFQKMIEANNVPAEVQPKMWGLTMAGILGIDPETKQRIR